MIEHLTVRPGDFTDGTERLVVGAVVVRWGLALTLKRKPDDFMPGVFELPSGKVESGETVAQALQRELREETGLSLSSVVEYLGSFDYLSGSGRRTRQYNYAVEVEEFVTILHPEHEAFRWVSMRAIAHLAMTPQTRSVVAKVLGDDSQSNTQFMPEHAPCLDHFRPLQNGTQCFFARDARLWGALPWDQTKSLTQNVSSNLELIESFVIRSRQGGPDAFIFEVNDENYGADIIGLGKTLRSVLATLAANDPAGSRDFLLGIEQPEWRFSFAGEPMFVATFSPLYSASHPRFSFGAPSIMIMLQPEHVFDRVLDPQRHRTRRELKQCIRQAYVDAGRGYHDTPTGTQPLDAKRYLKPLLISDPPLEWWKD